MDLKLRKRRVNRSTELRCVIYTRVWSHTVKHN